MYTHALFMYSVTDVMVHVHVVEAYVECILNIVVVSMSDPCLITSVHSTYARTPVCSLPQNTQVHVNMDQVYMYVRTPMPALLHVYSLFPCHVHVHSIQ